MGFVDVKQGCEHSLKRAVATQGPVSVAIDASHRSFQMYAGGEIQLLYFINRVPTSLDFTLFFLVLDQFL